MDHADHPPVAGRGIVSDPPGGSTTLTMYFADKALAELQIGPAEAVALASDMLNAARRRYGRASKETGQ